MRNGLIYDVNDKIPFGKNLLFALQQFLSIIAGTMLVPIIVDPSGTYLSQSAALIGAGVGTIVYLLFTHFKSPVFLGSSFAFIAPLSTAVTFGYFGVLIGVLFSSLVYVTLAIIIKFSGSDWINKIMPPVIIGPVVALIGFDLSASAIANVMNTTTGIENYNIVSILIGILTFLTVVVISVRGGKLKMFPFIVAILSSYVLCAILTLIGNATNVQTLQIIDFSPFQKIADFRNWLPNLTIVGFFKEGTSKITSFGDILKLFVAFVPVAVVSFAEHIADHKNISSIIDRDLLKNPGLHKTLLGDGVGSIIGSFFGGVPTTTYGESIGCVALSKNASTKTILLTSIICIVVAFFYPIIAFVETIPACLIGGVSIALYGFIAVSGLRMIKNVDLNHSKNLFIVASIFICGIGGLVLKIGSFEISNIACALLVGMLANAVLSIGNKKEKISQNSNILEENVSVDDNSNNNSTKTYTSNDNNNTNNTDKNIKKDFDNNKTD